MVYLLQGSGQGDHTADPRVRRFPGLGHLLRWYFLALWDVQGAVQAAGVLDSALDPFTAPSGTPSLAVMALVGFLAFPVKMMDTAAMPPFMGERRVEMAAGTGVGLAGAVTAPHRN